MPYKFEYSKENNKIPKTLDRRVKLSDEQKVEIKELHKSGLVSINGLARQFNVSKRTIQFILFPERAEKAKQSFKERRKDGRYYDKDKHKESVNNTRKYKKELSDKGLLTD